MIDMGPGDPKAEHTVTMPWWCPVRRRVLACPDDRPGLFDFFLLEAVTDHDASRLPPRPYAASRSPAAQR